MAERAVTHLFTHVRGLSGVESMVRRHLRDDPQAGLTPSAVSFFEQGDFTQVGFAKQVSGLGLTGSASGWTFRRRFQGAIAHHPVGHRIYHEAWGLPPLADLDRAQRRFAFLHSHWTGAENIFRGLRGLVDGIFCVSPAIRSAVRTCLPEIPEERLITIRNPVDPPPSHLILPPRRQNPEMVLGFCGRVVSQPKRVERLPDLARRLHARRIPHRWEILGDGPDRASLEEAFQQTGVPAHFHGAQTGEAVWRILAGWDVIVFASDFEGMPLALLEALSVGVLPLFPRLASGGRDTTEAIAPELVYESGQLDDAVRAVAWLRQQTPETWEQLRERGRQRLVPHSGTVYLRTYADFLDRIATLPRLSAEGPAARRRHLGEWMPFSLLKRLPASHPLRREYL